MSTNPSKGSRYTDYDEITISLLRRIDSDRDRRGIELTGAWQEYWNEVVNLAHEHLAPIVKIYTELDLGEMAKFLVRSDPTPEKFVLELSRHPRSFLEFGIPNFFSTLSRKLERLLFEVDSWNIKANNVLELAWILKEMARIFPEELPKAKDDDDLNDYTVDSDDGTAALAALKQGKTELHDQYYKIKKSVETELNASDPGYHSTRNEPPPRLRQRQQDHSSGWNASSSTPVRVNSEPVYQQDMESELPQRQNSGGFSTRPTNRVDGTRAVRQGSGLSPAALSSLPVRPPFNQSHQRSVSGGVAPLKKGSSSSSTRTPPSNELRRSVSDGLRAQSSWEVSDLETGGDSRGGLPGRGYSSRSGSGPRRDQGNGWGPATDSGSARRTKPEPKSKNKGSKTSPSGELGWGVPQEGFSEANSGWNNAPVQSTNSGWGAEAPRSEAPRGASRSATGGGWGGATVKQEPPPLTESKDSGWGSGTNINESAWGSGNVWAQSFSDSRSNGGGWGSSAPPSMTSKRGPPPGFGSSSPRGSARPSYPPGFGPRDGSDDYGEDEMESAEQYY
eukprot:g2933.t1